MRQGGPEDDVSRRVRGGSCGGSGRGGSRQGVAPLYPGAPRRLRGSELGKRGERSGCARGTGGTGGSRGAGREPLGRSLSRCGSGGGAGAGPKRRAERLGPWGRSLGRGRAEPGRAGGGEPAARLRGEGREARAPGRPGRHRGPWPRGPCGAAEGAQSAEGAEGAARAGVERGARPVPTGPYLGLLLGHGCARLRMVGRRQGIRQPGSGRVTLSARRSPAATARGAALCPPNPGAPVGRREVTWRMRVHDARARGMERAPGWAEVPGDWECVTGRGPAPSPRPDTGGRSGTEGWG